MLYTPHTACNRYDLPPPFFVFRPFVSNRTFSLAVVRACISMLPHPFEERSFYSIAQLFLFVKSRYL